VEVRAAGAFTSSLVLAWGITNPCSAESLPGRYEASVGGRYLLHHTLRCTTDLDTDLESCGEDWPFAGFDLAGHMQLGAWFALGARIAGSAYIDREKSNIPESEPFRLDRNLWLWSASLEARFDPLIWPRALWLGAELGAVLAETSVEIAQLKVRGKDDDRSVLGALVGLAVGWDFWLRDPVLLGLEIRIQAMTLEALKDPPNPTRRFNLQAFPYVSMGAHVGYRW
jgi:hypothetical protein